VLVLWLEDGLNDEADELILDPEEDVVDEEDT